MGRKERRSSAGAVNRRNSNIKGSGKPKRKKSNREKKMNTIFFGFIAAIVIIIIASQFGTKVKDVEIRVNYNKNVKTLVQIFWLDAQKNTSEKNSVSKNIDSDHVDMKVKESVVTDAAYFRLDCLDNYKKDVAIEDISIYVNGICVTKMTGAEIYDAHGFFRDVDLEKKDDTIILKSPGDDCQFHFRNEFNYSREVLNKKVAERRAVVIIVLFIVLAIVYLILFKYKKEVVYNLRALGTKINNMYLEKMKVKHKVLYGVAIFIVVLSTVLLVTSNFLYDKFSNISIGEILFHLKVPMTGTSDSMVEEYFRFGAVSFIIMGASLIIAIILFAIFKIIRNNALTVYTSLSASCIYLLVVILIFNSNFKVFAYLAKQFDKSTFIEDNYVLAEETELTFPEKKRNLIYIFLESMESTFISKDEGGYWKQTVIPELAELAKENINFSENDKIGGSYSTNGATWTVAGMVSQTSGTPLLIPIGGNSYNSPDVQFLPGVTSIGDILKEQGYNQEIVVGSDIAFGGRKLYFGQHGDFDMFDYNLAIKEGKIPKDYKVWWGYEDKKLFKFAKEELEEISKKDEPFNFTMLTVDTHFPSGYLCEDCKNEYGTQYENVYACSSRQVGEFVEWIQKQDFYENTTIVISGDHPTMDSRYIQQNYDLDKPRPIYNCVINPAEGLDGSNSKNRLFTTLDLFPTTLASIGVKIEGERLGLGTNLFSGEETLAEKYGYDKIDEEFDKKSVFYDKKLLGEK